MDLPPSPPSLHGFRLGQDVLAHWNSERNGHKQQIRKIVRPKAMKAMKKAMKAMKAEKAMAAMKGMKAEKAVKAMRAMKAGKSRKAMKAKEKEEPIRRKGKDRPCKGRGAGRQYDVDFERKKAWKDGHLTLVLATKASYVTYKSSKMPKPKLLVQISETMTIHHKDLMKKIFIKCADKNLDKDAAVAMRDRVIASL